MPPVDTDRTLSEGEMNIRAFLSSRETLSEIVDELGIVFRTLAQASSVKVLRGSKGTLPSYVEKYLKNLTAARPAILLQPVADANPDKVLIHEAVSGKPCEHAADSSQERRFAHP